MTQQVLERLGCPTTGKPMKERVDGFGCGVVRNSRFPAAHLAAIATLDGSSAVEASTRDLRDLPSAVVVRSDLRPAPSAGGSSDFVSHLGVRHHLDDPKEGVLRLVDFPTPGGPRLLYPHGRPPTPGVRVTAVHSAAELSSLTLHTSHRSPGALSAPMATLLFGGVVLPGELWGTASGAGAGGPDGRRRPQRRGTVRAGTKAVRLQARDT
jgi:hypothetical protein